MESTQIKYKDDNESCIYWECCIECEKQIDINKAVNI